MIASNVYIYTTTLPVPPRVRRTARMDAWTGHGRNAVSVYSCVSQGRCRVSKERRGRPFAPKIAMGTEHGNGGGLIKALQTRNANLSGFLFPA